MRNLSRGDRIVYIYAGDLPKAELEHRHAAYCEELALVDRQLRSEKDEILQRLAPFDAFDLMSGVLLAFLPHYEDPADAPDLHGVPAIPEYLALLLRERGSRAPSDRREVDELAFESGLNHGLQWIDRLVRVVPELLVPRPPPWEGTAEAYFKLVRNRFASRLITHPVAETERQADEATVAVLDDPDIAVALGETVGFDARAAMALVEAIASHCVEALGQLRASWVDGRAWCLGTGDSLAVDAAGLAARAGVSLDAAQSFIGRFAMPFDGERFDPPAFTTPARHRPLLRDEGRVVPVSLPMLRRAVRPSLLYALHEARHRDSVRVAHQRADDLRATWLERRAGQALSNTLRPDWAHPNLHYDPPARGEEPGEIDVLLRVGHMLISVEAKSGAARVDSEVMDPPRFFGTLADLVGKAVDQHDRARRALVEVAPLYSDERRRARAPVNLDGVEEVLPVSVTLDDVSALASACWHLRDVDMTDSPRLPWIVPVATLELFAELLWPPALLLHFLTRRLKANRARMFVAQDEVDWAMQYVLDELLWAELDPDHPRLPEQMIPSAEHRVFDAWFLQRQLGHNIPGPSPSLPDDLADLLIRLDRHRPNAWLTVSLAILDLPRPAREEVASSWSRQRDSDRAISARPQEVAFGPPARGFSFLREEPGREAILRDWCRVRKYQERADLGLVFWCLSRMVTRPHAVTSTRPGDATRRRSATSRDSSLRCPEKPP